MTKQTIFFFLLIGYCMAVLAQRPAQGPVSDTIFNPLDKGYQLVWEDDFWGKALDNTK